MKSCIYSIGLHTCADGTFIAFYRTCENSGIRLKTYLNPSQSVLGYLSNFVNKQMLVNGVNFTFYPDGWELDLQC